MLLEVISSLVMGLCHCPTGALVGMLPDTEALALAVSLRFLKACSMADEQWVAC